MTIARGSLRSEGGGRAGFTIIEFAIVVVVAGLLLVPLLRIAGSSIISTRLKETQSRLDTARDALVAFAAVNGGCLPFASDFEGGLPDTDASGAQSTPDTGDRSSNQNAGDLPWADLGLTNAFLDGDNLRIEYYVATPYTDTDANQATITCDAGFRGFQWDSGVTYDAPSATPVYVFDNDPGSGDRALYEIKKNKSLAAGTHPSDGGNDVTEHIDQLPDPLLEVRRGPDVTSATGGQNDVISAQNVFVLIAAGPEPQRRPRPAVQPRQRAYEQHRWRLDARHQHRGRRPVLDRAQHRRHRLGQQRRRYAARHVVHRVQGRDEQAWPEHGAGLRRPVLDVSSRRTWRRRGRACHEAPISATIAGIESLLRGAA